VLTLDNSIFDPDTLINLTTDRIVVPVDGYYQVNAVAIYGTAIQASLGIAYIMLNGTGVKYAGSAAANTNTFPVCMCSGIIYATAGDYFQVGAKHNATGTVTGVMGEIDIHLVREG